MTSFVNKLGAIAAGALAFSAFSGAAQAQTTFGSANITVSAKVLKECQLVTAPASTLPFGSISVLGTGNFNATNSSFVVKCSKGTAYTIAIDAGQNSANCGGSRCMKHASLNEYLKYALYRDSGYATAWGVPTSVNVTSTGRANVTYNIYAQIANADADVNEGDYSDTVALTLTY
ncbi:MAG: spore coat protein U domain-containing protein [Alphaproteobacteria bacterium]|nr:spore coat protein U domain-containing protein [Alphaproteobacteria bacterium]